MGKMKFLDNGGNYTSKGLVKDQVYEIGERVESKKNPGSFMCAVTGGVLTAPLMMWEKTIATEFGQVEAAAIQQTMNMSAGSENATAKPVMQTPIKQDTPAGPKLGVQDILNQMKMDQTVLLTQIQKNTQFVNPQKSEEHDLLLSELLKLDFQFMNIKLIKADGNVSMVIIVDGTEPLSISSKDVSAKSVVEAVTGAFTEQAMIISSIKDFRKRTTELLATKEAEAKAAAKPAPVKAVATEGAAPASTVKSRRSAAEKAAAGKPVETPTVGSPFEEPEMDDEPDADFTEERASNGISSEVEDFQLV